MEKRNRLFVLSSEMIIFTWSVWKENIDIIRVRFGRFGPIDKTVGHNPYFLWIISQEKFCLNFLDLFVFQISRSSKNSITSEWYIETQKEFR